MTVDIARMEHNAVATLNGSSASLRMLGEWVTAAQQAHALVAPLVDTAFVPEAYKPKVDPRATPEQKAAAYNVAVANATAAVLQGISLGIDPLMALQQIYIIHGRPGMYADMMVALVQSHGHEVWDEDLSDNRAVVCGRRKGTEHTVRVVITMDMARKAGWTSNQAYAKTPQDMLWARAASRVCKRIASDRLKGLASVEEIEDSIQVQATAGNATRTVNPPARPKGQIATALREARELSDRAEEPPLEAESVDAGTDIPAEPLMTPAQSKKLHALLGKAKLGDRDEGLAYLSEQVGRDIATSKELTKVEAMRVIDFLEQAPPADPEPDLDEALWADTAKPGGQS